MTKQEHLFSFIHCADLHLDSPLEGFKAKSPDMGSVLREATFKAFENVVNCAKERGADFILIAGDVYDGEDRSLRAQLRFREIVHHAVAEHIQVFIAHGNHDPLSGWEASLSFPPGVHRFGPDIESIPWRKDGEIHAWIHGVSYPIREIRHNLARNFHPQDPHKFNIGVLHANVGGHPEHDNYAPCSLQDLIDTGIDYWALGHVHRHDVLNRQRPYVVYSGNTQGRNIREDGPRGCYYVRVYPQGDVELDFIETDVVRWLKVEVNIEQYVTEDDLLNGIERELERARTLAGERPSVVHMVLNGRGPIHKFLHREGVVEDLVTKFRELESQRPDFCWLESLRNATSPDIDLASRREVEDFIGDFLRAAESLRTNPEGMEMVRHLLQEHPDHIVITRQLQKLTFDKLQSILQDAERLGLDLLLDETNGT